MAPFRLVAASLGLVLAGSLVACGGGSGAPGGGAGAGGGGGAGSGGPGAGFGDVHSGQYNLGPVDWRESQWHNACGPYTPDLEQLESSDELLAGLANGWAADGSLCDACVRITAASSQRSVVARIVTYGVTQGPNDIDLSPAAFAALDTGGARDMSWQLVACPDGGKIQYQFQTGANIWWTSLWVRDARLPVGKVEVESTNHADWFALSRNSDGTLDDGGGFGAGSFSLRVTAVDGQTVTDTFPGFQPGAVLSSAGQLK